MLNDVLNTSVEIDDYKLHGQCAYNIAQNTVNKMYEITQETAKHRAKFG